MRIFKMGICAIGINKMIIIAKYKEDISWLSNITQPVIVYDKSKDIPNVGREAETYLRYIVENYDKIEGNTIFLQGNPFDHINISREEFFNLLNNNSHISKFTPLNSMHSEIGYSYTNTLKSFEIMFNISAPLGFEFPPGAQFIVPKHLIHSRPLQFYELLRNDIILNNHVTISKNNSFSCPWTLERMWPYIFNPEIPLKSPIIIPRRYSVKSLKILN